eukprot:scaffold54627_cov33-Tisochrysis_lutea.AAC.2
MAWQMRTLLAAPSDQDRGTQGNGAWTRGTLRPNLEAQAWRRPGCHGCTLSCPIHHWAHATEASRLECTGTTGCTENHRQMCAGSLPGRCRRRPTFWITRSASISHPRTQYGRSPGAAAP